MIYNSMKKKSEQTTSILLAICIGLVLLMPVLLVGCGQKEAVKSPDLRHYDNGYDTVFVVGTRIEHPADTSTSIVVDWSREPAAKASKDLQVTEKKGIVYKHGEITDGRDEGQPLDLKMNLMVPASGAYDELYPVVLLTPGGGFIGCRIDNKYMDVQQYLAEHGYAVAIMHYHIIGEGRYFDAAQDVWDAVSWIREHGREHGLDPERIALMGNSAGGYVAALAACQGGALSGPEDADESASETTKTEGDTEADKLPEDTETEAGSADNSAIRCVVNFYGLCDLFNNKADYEEAAIEAQHKPNSSDSQFVNGVLSGKGLTDDLEEAEKADPRNYIDGKEPPFLHMHGDADLLVSPSQSLHLHEALKAAGVESTRYAVKGAAHGDAQFRTTAAMDITLDFLDRHCR